MFISNVKIKNFRNFKEVNVNLFPFSILIGENDTGKSNFIQAINLVLFNKSQNYFSKILFRDDFNDISVMEFYELLSQKGDFTQQDCYDLLPRIEVIVTFDNIDALGEETLAIVNNWIIKDEETGKDVAKIKYTFYPLNNKKEEIFKFCKSSLEKNKFLIPAEYYDYQIISLSDNKKVDSDELKRVNIMTIDAERDESSISLVNSRKNSILPKMLKDNLKEEDKVDMVEIYNNMVDSIIKINGINTLKNLFNESFNKILVDDDELIFLPNSDNYNDLLFSLKLGLNQKNIETKGLGTKNLVLTSLLLSKYISECGIFNLICIEEPEAHLSRTLLNKLINYLEDVQKESDINKKRQIIITTHSSYLINKLNIQNVVILKNDNIYNLSTVSDDTSTFFSKVPNYELLDILFLKKIILVEGPSEEIFINTILAHKKLKGEAQVLSINGISFKRYIEVWKVKKDLEYYKEYSLGIITDSDANPNRIEEYKELADSKKNVYVGITDKYRRTFELELIHSNKSYLEKLFSKKDKELEDYMTESSNKTICALKLSESIFENQEENFIVPPYIDNVLKKVIGEKYDKV